MPALLPLVLAAATGLTSPNSAPNMRHCNYYFYEAQLGPPALALDSEPLIHQPDVQEIAHGTKRVCAQIAQTTDGHWVILPGSETVTWVWRVSAAPSTHGKSAVPDISVHVSPKPRLKT